MSRPGGESDQRARRRDGGAGSRRGCRARGNDGGHGEHEGCVKHRVLLEIRPRGKVHRAGADGSAGASEITPGVRAASAGEVWTLLDKSLAPHCLVSKRRGRTVDSGDDHTVPHAKGVIGDAAGSGLRAQEARGRRARYGRTGTGPTVRLRDVCSGEASPPSVTRRKHSNGRSNISAGRRASAAR
jgi:hypothetical protein